MFFFSLFFNFYATYCQLMKYSLPECHTIHKYFFVYSYCFYFILIIAIF